MAASAAGILAGCGGKTAAEPQPAAPPVAAAPAPSLSWQTWKDPAGRFSVDLPGEPVEQRSKRPVDYGEATMERYLVDISGRTYGVTITVYPDRFAQESPTGQILASARQQAIRDMDATPTNDRPVTCPSPDAAGAELPGREVTIESQSMRMVLHSRWILSGATLFQIMLSGAMESTDAAHFAHMVSSFKLLPTGP